MAKKVRILELKPTQMAVGMLEVERKKMSFEHLSRAKLQKKLKERPVEVVVGPDKRMYLVDGHHRTLAALLAGEKKIFVKKLEDLSHRRLSYEHFWRLMKKNRWTHLFDQYGNGPHDPFYLAEDIRGLGDDPYRSLAWLVGEEGCFKKTKDPYEKFRWANLFREKKLLHCKFSKDIPGALTDACKLARSTHAKSLPGYIGKKMPKS